MADGNEAAARSRPTWKKSQTSAASAGPVLGRSLKLVLLTLLLLALLGALFAWVSRVVVVESVEFRSLAIAEYGEPLLEPPFAAHDSVALAECFGAKVSEKSMVNEELFTEAIKKLSEPVDGALVVHLCALAYSEGDGVYVIPGGNRRDAPFGKVALKKVLQALRQSKAKHKLLLLDLGRPVAGPLTGILVDDLAEELDAELDRENKADPFRFFVLTACESGAQVAQVSEELELSIFAHYLKLGLEGEADGWTERGKGSNKDGKVTVRELVEYVRRKVGAWAQQNRGTHQTPKLWGDANANFTLVRYATSGEDEDVDEAATRRYPDWLLKGWKVRDRWWNENGHRFDLWEYLKIESTLLRSEQQWRSSHDKRWRSDTKGPTVESSLKAALGNTPPVVTPPKLPLSLFAAMADRDPQAANELRPALLRQLQQHAKAGAAKEDAKQLEAEKAFLKKVDDLAKDYEQAAWLVCDVAADATVTVDLTREAFRYLHQTLVNLPRDEKKPVHVEIAWLHRLREFEKESWANVQKWPPTEVRQSLRTLQQAGLTWAKLAKEPRAVFWVEEELAEAESKRLKGQALLVTLAPSGNEAPLLLQQAGDLLQRAEDRYRMAAERIDIVTRMYETRDRACGCLTGWAALLAGRDPPPGQVMPRWSEHVRAVNALTAMLDGQVEARPTLTAEPPALDKARRTDEELWSWLNGRIERWPRSEKTKASAADYRELQSLLRSPLLTAGQRKRLWGQRVALAQALLDATDLKAPPLGTDDTTLSAECERAERRARISIDLLAFAGSEHAATLDHQVGALLDKADRAEWRRLGGALADAWRETWRAGPRPSLALEQWQEAVRKVEALCRAK
jgi:hypothetical protein